MEVLRETAVDSQNKSDKLKQIVDELFLQTLASPDVLDICSNWGGKEKRCQQIFRINPFLAPG